MSLSKVITEDRRLCILRLLNEEPDYSINHSVMKQALDALGHGTSEDVVLSEIAWLEEQGLVTVSTLDHGLKIVRITMRGSDVAAGRARVPGVKRPSPGRG
tara:strand:- start:8400 stop:8702 length:303 start_codon:yes stop_codon:yes gene_type:complete